jgi:hypothetical protein
MHLERSQNEIDVTLVAQVSHLAQPGYLAGIKGIALLERGIRPVTMRVYRRSFGIAGRASIRCRVSR